MEFAIVNELQAQRIDRKMKASSLTFQQLVAFEFGTACNESQITC
ncbi:MAG TPA: hypothetical protein V6D10_01665 [Trichocoleus sp.]